MSNPPDMICTGWDGANPLHALASFGLLNLADRMQPGARLGWRFVASAWRPVITPIDDPSVWCANAAGWLNQLGQVGSPDPNLNRRVRDLSAELKKANERIKEASKAARAASKQAKLDKEATRLAIDDALLEPKATLERLERETSQAKEALAHANGSGIAHLGDIISVTPGMFRRAARTAVEGMSTSTSQSDSPTTNDPLLVVRQLPSLACDQIVDGGKVTPTPLSFSNGSSGQCLLKDARACMQSVTPELLEASIHGLDGARVSGQTGLNWDPADQRSYALSWEDPATAGKETDVACQALAYLGLALLPCMPDRHGLTASGWSDDKSFTWPIWETPLPLSVVSSLLASQQTTEVAALRARGIAELRRSQVINPTGKRNFFAPSIPVA